MVSQRISHCSIMILTVKEGTRGAYVRDARFELRKQFSASAHSLLPRPLLLTRSISGQFPIYAITSRVDSQTLDILQRVSSEDIQILDEQTSD